MSSDRRRSHAYATGVHAVFVEISELGRDFVEKGQVSCAQQFVAARRLNDE